MKRTPILLASLLLLAGCTAPAQSTASAPAETAAAQAPAAANAGDVHMLTNRYDGGQYTNYTAFKRCLVHLTEYVPAGETIAMPYGIGCGLGGGNWEINEWYLKDVLQDQYTVELWRKG